MNLTKLPLLCLLLGITLANLSQAVAQSAPSIRITNHKSDTTVRYPVVLLQAFYGATGLACAATVILLVLAGIAALVSSSIGPHK